MSYQDTKQYWQQLCQLLEQEVKLSDSNLNNFVQRAIEQHISILNDVLHLSIHNLKHLQKIDTIDDAICSQVKFISAISKKLTLTQQHFLDLSLGQMTDYNDWLKAHCDLATD
jgi:hypothetical protein